MSALQSLLKIPVYENLWANRGSSESLPQLRKVDVVRGFPGNWMTPELQKAMADDSVEYVSTSGTTADRMQTIRFKSWVKEEGDRIIKLRPDFQPYWAAGYGRATLTTGRCVNTACFTEDPGPAKRTLTDIRTLFLNITTDPTVWRLSDIERMLHEINDQNLFVLDAAPAYLAVFLWQLEQHNLLQELKQPPFVTLSYEMATGPLRRYIESRVNARVIEVYATTEFGHAFMELAPRRLALCPEKLEVYLDPIAPDQGLYALLVNCWKNPLMPLHKYRVGDIAEVSPAMIGQDGRCHEIVRICGRERELLQNQSGRYTSAASIDDIVTESGGSDLLLYQVNVMGKDHVRLRYMTRSGDPVSALEQAELKERTQSLYELRCELSHERSISPEASGKYAIVKRFE